MVHQFLVYSDDVNILGGSVRVAQKNTEAFLAACKKTGLEMNAKGTEYMIIFLDRHAGKSHNIMISN